MSKPTKEEIAQERAALLTIADAVLEDYLTELPSYLSPEARKEWARLRAYIATRKQKLLAPPAPKQPKASRKQDNEWTVITPQEVYKVIPAPDGLKHTDNAITKRSRRDGR